MPKALFKGLFNGLLLLGLISAQGSAWAEDYDELDERLRAIEDRITPVADDDDDESPAPPAESGGMLGMVNDLQRLQEEVRKLRGDVERLQFEAEQNRSRQRDMFLDIEKRLSALEKGGAPQQFGAPATVTPPPTQATAPGVVNPATSNTPATPNPATGAPAAITPPQPVAGTSAPQTAQPTTVPAAPQPAAPNPAAEQEAYLQAFEMLKQGRYDESITAFQGFLQRFPNGDYADNARYWLAETYYVKKDYPVALQHFQQLLTQHPDSSKLPGALLKVGYIQYELGANAEARLALERVRNEFAASSVADLAKQRLERMDREGR